MKKVITLLSVAISTVGVLLLLQPVAYRSFSSDFDRHLTVQQIISELQHDSEVKGIVFGDSRAMFGLDTKTLAEYAQLSTNEKIYNASSVGQGLYESSYYYPLVKDSIQWVAQCFSISYLNKDIPYKIDDGKNISMFLSGYKLNDETRDFMGEYDPFFDRLPLLNLLECRTYFSTYVHNGIRPFLDDEKFDREKMHSLYFPHIYTEPQHPNYPNGKYDCSRYCRESEPVSQLALLKKAASYFHDKGTNYIVILMPVNKDACAECQQDFERYKALLESIPHLRILDLTNLLERDQFYDLIHANTIGAEIVTNEVGNYLATVPQ